MELSAFMKYVRRFAKSQYPGWKPEAFTLRFENGQSVRLPIQRKKLGKVTSCIIAGASEQLAENEMQVLAHVPDHDKKPATSKEIAAASGYKHNPYFYGLLRSLRKKDLVVMEAEGYRKKK